MAPNPKKAPVPDEGLYGKLDRSKVGVQQSVDPLPEGVYASLSRTK